MNPTLFRQTALERMSSPERLDTLMEVVNLKAWIALCACLVVLLAGLAWGIFGRVADDVAGMGILAREGGLFNVETAGTGPLLEVRVKPGDTVAKGQVVATLGRPELEGQLREAQLQLDLLEPRRTAGGSLRALDLDREIAGLRGRIGLLRARLEAESIVACPFAGKIVEVLREPGQFVPAGTAVARLEISAEPYVCYLFVPMAGKRLVPGMAVQMEPAGIPPEEFGRMLGRVRAVSHSPSSLEAMDLLLHNERLAARLGGDGDAYLVEVRPELDPATVSGFRWTSRKGPPVRFGGGTLLAGRIRIREQAPLALLIPALGRWLEGRGHG